MSENGELTFRPEDTEARATGKLVVRRWTIGRRELVWLFFPSGFQVLAWLKPLPIIDLNLAFRYGADHEGPRLGIAHALEHLVCDDAVSTDLGPAFKPLLRHGIKNNGWTDYQMVWYWLQTRRQATREAINGLLDMAFAPHDLNQKAWAREQAAILQEFRGHGEDRRINQAIRTAQYPHFERRHQGVIGTPESIQALTLDTLKEAHDTWYHPQNALLVVQGLGSIDEVIRLVETHEALNRCGERPRPRLTQAPALRNFDGPPRSSIHVPGGTNVERMILTSDPYESTRLPEELWRCGGIIAQLFSMNGGLITEELRRKRSIVYDGELDNNSVGTGRHFLEFNGEMAPENMTAAADIWRALWPQVCRSLPDKKGPYALFVKAFKGTFELERARYALHRFHDDDASLREYWVQQDPTDPTPGNLECGSKQIDLLIADAPKLADLEWRELRVLRA